MDRKNVKTAKCPFCGEDREFRRVWSSLMNREVYIPMSHKCKPKFSVELELMKTYKDGYRCPDCSSYNETWEKREKTVGEDEVYCWHCGCKVRLGKE